MDGSPYRSAHRAAEPGPRASYLPQLRPALFALALAVGGYGATRTPPPTTWPSTVACDDYAVGSPILPFPAPPPASGRIIGKIAATAHQLSVAPDGALMPGTRVPRSDSVLILRPKQ